MSLSLFFTVGNNPICDKNKPPIIGGLFSIFFSLSNVVALTINREANRKAICWNFGSTIFTLLYYCNRSLLNNPTMYTVPNIRASPMKTDIYSIKLICETFIHTCLLRATKYISKNRAILIISGFPNTRSPIPKSPLSTPDQIGRAIKLIIIVSRRCATNVQLPIFYSYTDSRIFESTCLF